MYIVCWNKHQYDWLKIETLEEHIKSNLSAFAENSDHSMALLGMFDTHDEAMAFCDKLIDEFRLSKIPTKY